MKLDIKNLCPNIFLNVCIIIVIALGIIARLYIAKNGIGFYVDDTMLLVQLDKFSYFDLLTKHLNFVQVCPPLLAIILKFLYSHFGLNHQILGLVSLISSCLALIFLPITAYKICKNKYAALIAVSLLAFNPHVLYFTQRLKQYSTDIFLSIILIYIGCTLFSKSVSKKNMALFTIFCIICGLLSYTAIIIIACLIFYYLFLFDKDNIKTKIINFLIFLIPWLIVFVPYLILVAVPSINYNCIDEWRQNDSGSHIKNYDNFKVITCFLFGDGFRYGSHPHLSISDYDKFYYLFFPIVVGIIGMFIKQDKYLFSTLVLPIIAAQILGMLYIYPLTDERIILWLCPIFILLFILPIRYIKFNKNIIACLTSCIIIIYYLFIYNNQSIEAVKSYLNGFNYQQNTVKLYVENLIKSDITDNDIIFINSELILEERDCEYWLDIFDKDGKLHKNQKICDYWHWHDNGFPLHMPEGKNIYFYMNKDGFAANLDGSSNLHYNWIKQNMNIIYEYETPRGDKFIKAVKK